MKTIITCDSDDASNIKLVLSNNDLDNPNFADEIRKERVTHCDDINCPECPKAAYEAGVKAEREEAVSYIGYKQGWEESEDVYREHFGLPTKYK